MYDLNSTLIFDIETEASPEALALVPEPKAPKNYKDPDKIAQYVAEKKLELTSNAALDPDLGHIAAIGIRQGLYGTSKALLLGDAGIPNERVLIGTFWEFFYASAGMCAGYNILEFDLPFLLRRSFDLGLKPSRQPDMRKWGSSLSLDLYQVLYHGKPGHGLKWVCKRYGIPNSLDELDGSQFAEMDPATRREYVRNDVELTAQLLERMNGIYL